MLSLRKKPHPAEAYLEEAIEQCSAVMLKHDADTDEFKKANEQFIKLLDYQDKIVSGKKIKPETWALIISNLVGILIVLNYEHAHVVTSKAFSWITKPKI